MAGTNNSINGYITISGQLTSAQIKAIHGTPIQVVAAPGTGKIIQVVSAFVSFIYGGSNVFVAGASQTIPLYYSTTTLQGTLITNAMIIGAGPKVAFGPAVAVASTTTSTYANLALNFYNPIATEITGNAAGDNVINWSITYIIVST